MFSAAPNPSKKPKPGIPKISASRIVPDDTCIQIIGPTPQDGNISSLETSVINKLIKCFNPRTIFEIGTFDGRTTLNMAAHCSGKTKVYTLDVPKDMINRLELPLDAEDVKYINKDISGEKFLGSGYENKIKQLYGDSAVFDFSPFFHAVDFVFIDGSHSYEYTLNDSMIAAKLLRSGSSAIVWHDYGTRFWEGVTRALNELYAKDKFFRGIKHIEGTSLACLVKQKRAL